jgi:hypothetical protein
MLLTGLSEWIRLLLGLFFDSNRILRIDHDADDALNIMGISQIATRRQASLSPANDPMGRVCRRFGPP